MDVSPVTSLPLAGARGQGRLQLHASRGRGRGRGDSDKDLKLLSTPAVNLGKLASYGLTHQYLQTVRKCFSGQLSSAPRAPPAACPKCNQPISRQPQIHWAGSWACDWPDHAGDNDFGESDAVFGCGTSKCCDWGVCQDCWVKIRGASELWTLDDDDDLDIVDGGAVVEIASSPGPLEAYPRIDVPGGILANIDPVFAAAVGIPLPGTPAQGAGGGGGAAAGAGRVDGGGLGLGNGVDDLADGEDDEPHVESDHDTNATVDPRRLVAMSAFQGVMREVIMAVADHADKIATALKSRLEATSLQAVKQSAILEEMVELIESDMDDNAYLSFDVIKAIFSGSSRLVLVEYFYRILIGESERFWWSSCC